MRLQRIQGSAGGLGLGEGRIDPDQAHRDSIVELCWG